MQEVEPETTPYYDQPATRDIEEMLAPHLASESEMAEALYVLALKIRDGADSDLVQAAQTGARDFLQTQYEFANKGFGLLVKGAHKRAVVFYVFHTMYPILDDASDGDGYTNTAAYKKVKMMFENLEIEESGGKGGASSPPYISGFIPARPQPPAASKTAEGEEDLGDDDEDIMFKAFYGTETTPGPQQAPSGENSNLTFDLKDLETVFERYTHSLKVSPVVLGKRRVLHSIATTKMGDISPADAVGAQPHTMVPALDAVTGLPMKFPIIGKNCRHVRCFDARTYFMLFEGRKVHDVAKNICMICRKPLPPNEVYLDQFTQNLLRRNAGGEANIKVTLSDCYE